ncbi:DUF6382 domain-containing protein [Paenibacillus sp. WLX1005]|uniref:DUF6382 domain-containing protein n=1 Tax=Paenibacillus sp. WLX1005 TaxID=3243766 RepID=UPI003983F342
MSTTLIQDFIQDGKTFMVIHREAGFQHSDLSRTQSGMMLSSRIHGMLQLHLHEVNLQAQLRYDITGKRMLKHCLQSEMIGIAEYFGLLLQLVSTLEESSQYMLSLPNYVLDEDYMFMEGSLQAGKLFLTYIPCTVMLTEEPVQQQISRLASHWMTAVRELSGNDVQRLLRYCQSETFTLQELKYMLMDLLAGGQEQHNPSSPDSSLNMPRPGDRDWYGGYDTAINTGGQENSLGGPPFSIPIDNHQANHARHDTAHSAPPHSVQSPVESAQPAHTETKRSVLSFGKKKEASAASLNIQPETGDMEVEPNKLPSAYRTYLLAGGALLIAMIWRYGYMEHPNDMMLYGCTALTLATFLTIYMIVKGKITLGKTKKSAGPPDATMQQKTAVSLFGKKQHHNEVQQEEWRWQPAFAGQSATAMSGAGANTGNGVHASNAEVAGITAIANNAAYSSSIPVAGTTKSSNQNAYHSHTSSDIREFRSSQNQHPHQNQQSFDPADIPNYVSQPSYAAYDPDHREHQSGSDSSAYAHSIQINNMPTQSLSSHMATVLLDDLEPQSTEESPAFRGYLERREANGNAIESIRLGAGSFIIGRADDGVHYHEQSVGTSRNHVELDVRKGQVTIKDLSSRNGTILNGEALIPYKAYPIQNGDSFKVAKAVYTLRLET